MRRGTTLVLGLLVASTTLTAVPQAADARPAILNALRGIVTAPLAILGGGLRHARRHGSYRHSYASHRARPAAAAAAVAGGAAAGAVATTGANPAPTPLITAPASTTAAAPAPETSGTGGDAMAAAPASPALDPAASQRNAALAVPTETQGHGSEPVPSEHPQPRLGTVGPPAWPSAFEDVIGFALWPKDYGEQLRVHGIGDVLVTAFAPSASLAARTRHGVQQARADEPGKTAVASACGSWDLTSSDWPLAQISSTIELNAAQKSALDQLKTALNDAGASIKAVCRDDTNQTPVERLRTMQNTLWAVHDAAQLIRAPLANFYDQLSDQQKQQFAAPTPQQTDPRVARRGDMAKMCGMPTANEVPTRQIDQSLRPTKAQRASLDALQKKSFEMGQFLMASCLKPLPATPAERLDAAADRLTAVIFAASNVNMALNDFTGQLSEEQKTKLNSMVR